MNIFFTLNRSKWQQLGAPIYPILVGTIPVFSIEVNIKRTSYPHPV
jgi:hypothetical protein